jgi:hypothetical protein
MFTILFDVKAIIRIFRSHYGLVISDRVFILPILKAQLQSDILTPKGYLHMKIFLLSLWAFYLMWIPTYTDSFISWVLFFLVGLAVTYCGVMAYFKICIKIDDARNPIDTVSVESTATKISTRKVEPSQENRFDYESYYNGHSEKEWGDIGLKVSTKYKTTAKKYYSFEEIEVSQLSLRYPLLTKNQRKVKILGGALVKRVKSKKRACHILINQYGFKINTAEYAVGYEGYYDW